VLVVEAEPTPRRRVWLVLVAAIALAGFGTVILLRKQATPAPLEEIALEPSYVRPPDAAQPVRSPDALELAGPARDQRPPTAQPPRNADARAPTGSSDVRTSPPPAPARRAVPTPAAPARPGLLIVNATPWGQLFVDNQLVGNTPRGNLSITAGQHVVRVQREGFEPFERTIEVAPGETVRLTDIVLRPKSQ